MNEGKRPGGLTALAVINFVLGGLLLLGVLGFIGGGIAMDHLPDEGTAKMSEEERGDIDKVKKMFEDPTMLVLNGLSVPCAALIIISGIGYLKQKKVMGYILGNSYALFDIATTILGIFLIDSELVEGAGEFNIMTIVGFIYPVLTLILLNTTFKEDFTN